ncbi:glycosyltransferase family 2 protein [Lactococcus taiwanensis]|uniref:glycosyltransferase family 2 protein n=1 Tax=Lactococcus taiwanensis TaxID=1151742 RepID=UPI003D0AD24F
MKEKVSVVITCYNHEEYIAECLRSIFSQSYQNIELLVFNDGSTDSSGAIINQLLSEESPYEETYYFTEKNRGLAHVRNDALQKITGDFLLFVDSDNFLESHHIETLLTKLKKTNSDIAYCQLWNFQEKQNILAEDLEFSLEKMLQGNIIDASSLVRVSKIQNASFDLKLNNRALEDYDFWLNLIVYNEARPIFVEETKLNYRVVDGSMSERGNWKNYYKSYFYILDKYKRQIPQDIIEALKGETLRWLEQYEVLLNDSKNIITQRDEYIQKQETLIKVKESENKQLRNSRSFRLGNKLLHPFRKIKP